MKIYRHRTLHAVVLGVLAPVASVAPLRAQVTIRPDSIYAEEIRRQEDIEVDFSVMNVWETQRLRLRVGWPDGVHVPSVVGLQDGTGVNHTGEEGEAVRVVNAGDSISLRLILELQGVLGRGERIQRLAFPVVLTLENDSTISFDGPPGTPNAAPVLHVVHWTFDWRLVGGVALGVLLLIGTAGLVRLRSRSRAEG